MRNLFFHLVVPSWFFTWRWWRWSRKNELIVCLYVRQTKCLLQCICFVFTQNTMKKKRRESFLDETCIYINPKIEKTRKKEEEKTYFVLLFDGIVSNVQLTIFLFFSFFFNILKWMLSVVSMSMIVVERHIEFLFVFE